MSVKAMTARDARMAFDEFCAGRRHPRRWCMVERECGCDSAADDLFAVSAAFESFDGLSFFLGDECGE